MDRIRNFCLLGFLLGATAAVGAQEMPEGWLCCNLRTDGAWISDINYEERGKTIIPVGTPVKVTGYGRNRVHIEIGGKRQAIGNDYSRDIPLEAFARRYVVTEDPARKLAAFPPKIREAIAQARVTKGMTREQVTMAVGYPVSSENPSLDAKVWRFWLWSFSEFRVSFDNNGRVTDIETDAATRAKVVLE